MIFAFAASYEQKQLKDRLSGVLRNSHLYYFTRPGLSVIKLFQDLVPAWVLMPFW